MVQETFKLEIEPLRVPISRTEDGAVRVGNTRVSLTTVLSHFNSGETPEYIVECFPTLKLADVYAVIAFYLEHRSEVDAWIAQEEREAEAMRQKIESKFDPKGIRKQLSARRNK